MMQSISSISPRRELASVPTLADIQAAQQRIAPYAHRTPVLTCVTIDRMVNANLFFKCENLQKVGAFKFRGACNAVLSLSRDDALRGVATHSSGNHAAGLALAARIRGIEAVIVMPHNAAEIKKAAVQGYGARIVSCEPTLESRQAKLDELVASRGLITVHPYNDPRVIAGQGTAALELFKSVPELDTILVPVGGGGLISGTAIAQKGVSPQTQTIGVEPDGADDAYRSLQLGRIIPIDAAKTIADGLRSSLGTLTFAVIQSHVHSIVCVSEKAIADAMRLVWERMKLVVEPSAAVPLAALVERRISLDGQRVGVIFSGGNVDLDQLPWQRGRIHQCK